MHDMRARIAIPDPSLSSSMATASTLTIEVQHGRECPYRKLPGYKNNQPRPDPKPPKLADCHCRKRLYVYGQGKERYESAKTRSWEKAEELRREKLNDLSPATIEARRFQALQEELIAQKEREIEAARARRILLSEALAKWMATLRRRDGTSRNLPRVILGKRVGQRRNQYHIITDKLTAWAKEKGYNFLDEIDSVEFEIWRSQWSPEAENRRDRLAGCTQNQYLSHMHRFFEWTVAHKLIDRDPSITSKSEPYRRTQTQPLQPAREQFARLLEATRAMDRHRYRPQTTPAYGRDLRAVFELQRWTGIRISDALTIKRSAITRKTNGVWVMNIVTLKTGAQIVDRPLPVSVVAALGAIPEQQAHVRPGYYFWSKGMADYQDVAAQWQQRIRKLLTPWLALTGERGEPLHFHSHMLRDTFAVELLNQGRPIVEVSKLLTHDSIQTTEKYYAPWVNKRVEMLHENMVEAMLAMGAQFTPDAAPACPAPGAPPRVM